MLPLGTTVCNTQQQTELMHFLILNRLLISVTVSVSTSTEIKAYTHTQSES